MSDNEPFFLISAWTSRLRHFGTEKLGTKVHTRLLARKPLLHSGRKTRDNIEAWFKDLETHHALSAVSGTDPMFRAESSVRSHLYHPVSGPGKKLLVGWGGMANRLMMPIANYLPLASKLGWDVLLLQPDRAKRYQEGVGRFGSSFEKTVIGLDSFIKKKGYGRLAVMGTSAGGIPALLSAARLGADNCMVVGMGAPEDSGYVSGWEEIERIWSSRRPPKLHLTAGGDAVGDVAVAERCNRILGGKTHIVVGQGHATVWPMLRSGQFVRWFEEGLE